MTRFSAFAIVGALVAATPALAQQAGTAPEAKERKVERRIYIERRSELPVQGCGFLGIYPTDVGRRAALRLGLGETRGALVSGVVEETGASRAGIHEKDVITGFNGQPISSEAQLRRLIITQTPGTWVRLDVMRGGQTLTVNAEITSRSRYDGGPDCDGPVRQERHRDAVRDMDLGSLERFEQELRGAESELDAARRELRMSVNEIRTQRGAVGGYEGTTGMGLQRMSPQLAQYFKTGSSSGALVNEVADGSPALRAGMQAGDVIVEVNGAAVNGPMDAVKAIVADTDGVVDLLIVREGERRSMQIRTSAEQPLPRQTPSTAPGTPELGSSNAPATPMRLARGVESLR